VIKLQSWLSNNNISLSTIIAPDFDYSWYKFVSSQQCTIVETTIPYSPIDKSLCHPQSICLALLYPEEFDWNTDILFGYVESTDSDVHNKLSYKLSIYANPIILWPNSNDINCDDINLWNVTNDDITLLNALKQLYTNNNVTLPDYDSLNTVLSKLIWIFLNYCINGDVNIDNLSELTPQTLLELAYQIKVCHHIYESVIVSSTTIETSSIVSLAEDYEYNRFIL